MDTWPSRRPSIKPSVERATSRGLFAQAVSCIGTFVLVFCGCGAAVLVGSHIGFAGVAFAFGFLLLLVAYTIGPISGCHINPAVTFTGFVAHLTASGWHA
jgi:glycerol uptake facilitator-like aquaporin